MKNDFKLFIDGIKEKTGLVVCVFSMSGELVGGGFCGSICIPQTLKGVEQDVQSGKTFFVIKNKQKKYVAMIDGAS